MFTFFCGTGLLSGWGVRKSFGTKATQGGKRTPAGDGKGTVLVDNPPVALLPFLIGGQSASKDCPFGNFRISMVSPVYLTHQWVAHSATAPTVHPTHAK